MNVEQLYWKLKELRDRGHADKPVMLYVEDANGDEIDSTVEEVWPDEYCKTEVVFLAGEVQ